MRGQPIHLTCRVLPRVGNLRCQLMYAASIQRSHLHLLVEVESGEALTRGISGFLISAARHINGALGARGARVFERYHARSLATPREVRNCIAYGDARAARLAAGDRLAPARARSRRRSARP